MPLRNIPDPRLHDWATWIDTVVAYNTRASRMIEAGVSPEDPETGWRDIADRLTLLEPTTPRHDDFADWREWAINLMAVSQG